MTKVVEPMTSGTIWKRLTFFALPLFLGNLFQQLYNTVDSLIVGNFLGSSALAAVSSSGSLIFMLIGFLSGIAGGAGVVVARLFGAEDNEGVQRAVHTTVAFGLVAGVAMTALGVLLSPQILIWMDTPESVLPQSITYLRIYFAGSLFFVMYNIFVGILQAVGDSRHPLYYLMVSSVVNLVLDVVFIEFVHTGVGGAAFATVISQAVSAFLCLAHLMRSKECYRLSLRRLGFDPFLLREIIRLGLPSGVQNSIIAFANLVVQSNINTFGAAAMAGCGSYSKVEGFAFLPITCFAMALSTFVGQNLGARQYDRVKKGVRFGILCSVVLAELMGVAIFFLGPHLIALFNSTPDVVDFGTRQAKLEAFAYFLLAFSHCIAGIMRGAGKAMVPMFTMLVSWCLVRIAYITIVIRYIPKIEVVFSAYPLTWFISSVIFLVYFLKADWLHNFDRLEAKQQAKAA